MFLRSHWCVFSSVFFALISPFSIPFSHSMASLSFSSISSSSVVVVVDSNESCGWWNVPLSSDIEHCTLYFISFESHSISKLTLSGFYVCSFRVWCGGANKMIIDSENVYKLWWRGWFLLVFFFFFILIYFASLSFIFLHEDFWILSRKRPSLVSIWPKNWNLNQWIKIEWIHFFTWSSVRLQAVYRFHI